jgi:hypothetical protein
MSHYFDHIPKLAFAFKKLAEAETVLAILRSDRILLSDHGYDAEDDVQRWKNRIVERLQSLALVPPKHLDPRIGQASCSGGFGKAEALGGYHRSLRPLSFWPGRSGG